MKKYDDGIHHCDTCLLFPCHPGEEVRSSLCFDCTDLCCAAIIYLKPCEYGKYHEDVDKPNGKRILRRIHMNPEPYYCFYLKDRECTIHDNQPILCRMSTCPKIEKAKKQ